MIYPMVPFPVTLTYTITLKSRLIPRFQGDGVIFMLIDALSILCAQLTRDLLAIAKFLFCLPPCLSLDFVCSTLPGDRRLPQLTGAKLRWP